MHVIRRRGWEIPERLATPEPLFFNRRSFLAATGAAALALSPSWRLAQRVADLPDPTKDLYPAKRNEKYVLDRPRHRREDQYQLQQFLRVRLEQERRQGGAGTQVAAVDGQDRRHGGEAAGDRHRRPRPQDAAGGAALSPPLRRGVVDGDPMDRLSLGQAGGIGQAAIVGEIRADGDFPRSRRSRRATGRPGIPGPTSKA